jgi:spore coat protein W
MTENKFEMDQSQQKLMELLVSRTMRKHGVKTGRTNLSEKEKEKLKSTLEFLQMQANKVLNNNKQVTEEDPTTQLTKMSASNVNKEETTAAEEQATKEPRPNKLNLARRRRKNKHLE